MFTEVYGEAPAKSLKSLSRKLYGSYGKTPAKSLISLYGSYGSLPLLLRSSSAAGCGCCSVRSA
jgi:hypothetical protein